jgi:hypothetical protein
MKEKKWLEVSKFWTLVHFVDAVELFDIEQKIYILAHSSIIFAF